jgi:hypothetical protein
MVLLTQIEIRTVKGLERSKEDFMEETDISEC